MLSCTSIVPYKFAIHCSLACKSIQVTLSILFLQFHMCITMNSLLSIGIFQFVGQLLRPAETCCYKLCVRAKTIRVALLIHSGFGLALPECRFSLAGLSFWNVCIRFKVRDKCCGSPAYVMRLSDDLFDLECLRVVQLNCCIYFSSCLYFPVTPGIGIHCVDNITITVTRQNSQISTAGIPKYERKLR